MSIYWPNALTNHFAHNKKVRCDNKQQVVAPSNKILQKHGKLSYRRLVICRNVLVRNVPEDCQTEMKWFGDERMKKGGTTLHKFLSSINCFRVKVNVPAQVRAYSHNVIIVNSGLQYVYISGHSCILLKETLQTSASLLLRFECQTVPRYLGRYWNWRIFILMMPFLLTV